MKKPTLCVIFGGKSREYYVSLRSAYGIISSLDNKKYDVVRVGITKEGKWLLYEGQNENILNDTWHTARCVPVTLDLSNGNIIVLDRQIYVIEADLFFPVLHGDYGEDGRLQGLFEIADVKYVGCNAFSSHICMDKSLTKEIAEKMGVRVSKGACLTRAQGIDSALNECEKIGYPVFVKPCLGGSSVGASLVKDSGELATALDVAFQACDKVLIEEYIEGNEAEVAVMEYGGEILVTRVGMIRHGSSFYDYDAKYNSPGNEYLIPAPIDEGTDEEIRQCAKDLFYALGCRGLSRFDFFVTERGAVFNEVNTMPGFTDISMFPKLFMHYGYTYGEIIDRLIENSLCT